MNRRPRQTETKTSHRCPECGASPVYLREDGTMRRHRDDVGPCPMEGQPPEVSEWKQGVGPVGWKF